MRFFIRVLIILLSEISNIIPAPVMLFCILVISFLSFIYASPPEGPGYSWKLIFEDNFNGTSLDTGKWIDQYPWGRTHNHNAYMKSGNIGVANGILTITPSGDEVKVDNTIVFASEFNNGNSSTADTIDWGTGNKQKSTLTGNCTYTFTAPSGVGNFLLKLVQDATGSRTVTWPATVKWPGGTAPTLSTAGGSVDIVSFYYDGSSYFGNSSLDFS